jgi:hypothetical protein
MRSLRCYFVVAPRLGCTERDSLVPRGAAAPAFAGSHSCLTRSNDRSIVGWVERSETQQQIFSATINLCNIVEPDPQEAPISLP